MRWTWFYSLASPPGIYRFADRCLPWAVVAWAVLLAVGLYWSLFVAPPDYQQGDAYRIIFIHVPSAWMSLFVWTTMAVAAVIGMVWKFKLAMVFITAAAPIGALLTFLTLATGSIWGKPMWGAWWVWDARLTSELVLLFLYLGVITLVHSIDQRAVREPSVYILVLVGAVNIPIIHYSVEWWASLHQPASILKFSAPSIHPDMLKPLLLMAVAFKLFFFITVLLGMQIQLLKHKWIN